MSRQNARLFFVDDTFPTHGRFVPHHHSQGLVGPIFQPPQSGDCCRVLRVTAQVKAADPLDRRDAAFGDNPTGLRHCSMAPFRTVEQVELGPTVRAADRLGVVAPGRRIRVLSSACRTHRKILHARPLSVVGQLVENRQPRAAVRTVDKRMQITPIVRIEKLRLALVANGDVRRDENRALHLFAVHNLKVVELSRGVHRFDFGLQHNGPLRRGVLDLIFKSRDLFRGALSENFHPGTAVAHLSADPEGFSISADRRPEPDALNDAVQPDAVCDLHVIHGDSTAFLKSQSGASRSTAPQNAWPRA